MAVIGLTLALFAIAIAPTDSLAPPALGATIDQIMPDVVESFFEADTADAQTFWQDLWWAASLTYNSIASGAHASVDVFSSIIGIASMAGCAFGEAVRSGCEVTGGAAATAVFVPAAVAGVGTFVVVTSYEFSRPIWEPAIVTSSGSRPCPYCLCPTCYGE